MKLKYYLRGLGIGIIVTTMILMISFATKKDDISNEEIIARAAQLGMIMPTEETEAVPETQNTETKDMKATEQPEDKPTETSEQAEGNNDTQTPETVADDTQTADTQTADTQGDGDAAQQAQEQQTPEPYALTISKGDVCRTVCENLAANGVVDDAESLRKYLFEIGYASSISIGNYSIPYNLTYEQIAQILQAGPIEQ